MRRALDALPEDAALFVAEVGNSSLPVGVAYLETATDYFTHERHGHLSILSVADQAEGLGVGRVLMENVEGWAKTQGHRFITLNVFAENGRAVRFYEKGGYAPDMIRYAKVINP